MRRVSWGDERCISSCVSQRRQSTCVRYPLCNQSPVGRLIVVIIPRLRNSCQPSHDVQFETLRYLGDAGRRLDEELASSECKVI